MPQIPLEDTILPGDLPSPPSGVSPTDTVMVSRDGVGEFKVPVSDLLGGSNIVDWDLTPSTQLSSIQPMVLPPPYNTVLMNAVDVVGNAYTADYVAPSGGYSGVLGAAKFTETPLSGDTVFYWKPLSGASNNKLIIITASFTNEVEFYHVPGQGLRLNTASYTDWVDPAFSLGDTVMIQITAAGALSIKTPNVTTGVLDTLPLAAGSSVVAMVDLSPGTPTGSGELAGSDLGSGLIPDAGFNPPSSIQPAGLPAGAANKDILRVTVPGQYQNVNYAVNEAALVLDAANGIVAPMAYESIIQPLGIGLYFVNVGPAEEHKNLSTLHAELASKGIFPKYLYVAYRDTTVPDTTEIVFPGLVGAVLMTDSGLGNVVSNSNAAVTVIGPASYGVTWEGAWNLGNVTARNIRLGHSLVLHTNTFDGINIECASSNAVIHAASNATPIRIKNFGVMSNLPLSTGQYCHFFAGDGAVAGRVEFSGNCSWTTVFLHGCSLDCVGGYHSGGVNFYDAGLLAANIPNVVVTIKEGANVHIPTVFSDISEVGVQVPYGVYLDRGIGYAWGASGDITSITNVALNVPTSNGMIFG